MTVDIGGCAVRWPWVWPPSAALEGGARWLAVLEEDEPDGGRDGVERSETEPIGHLTALRRRKRFFGLQPQNDKRAPAGLLLGWRRM